MQSKAFLPQGLAIGNLLNALSEGATRAELVEKSGISLRTMNKLVPYMIEQPRLIHIGDWRRRVGWGGPPDPIYLLGNKRHAEKPKPKPAAEATQRYRAKLAIRKGHGIGYSIFAPMAQASL